MFNRILVAFKFTPAGKQALAKAVELAREYGSELVVFHALDFALQRLHPHDPKIADLASRAAKKIARLIGAVDGHADKIVYCCRPADPALGTCREAATVGAHMIVLGAHKDPRRASLARLDYVGQTILEKAPCPVMLVPHPAE